MKTAALRFGLSVAAALLVGVVAGGLYSVDLYSAIKVRQSGYRGKIHQFDPVLGYAPVPGSTGACMFSLGPDVPIRFDDKGYRVPLSENGPHRHEHPFVLAIGDSMTFCNAPL